MWWSTLNLPFYLTGGTALGRYYLNHRYSEDLDFFVNNDTLYLKYIKELKIKIQTRFIVNNQQSLFSEDFTRLFISEDDLFLKIDLINDVDYYVGSPENYEFGLIDTPVNILSNKLTAAIGRDEPKDIFDIIHLAQNYSFNWTDIFYHAKQKAVMNELDVEQRFVSFPVEWLDNVNWLNAPLDIENCRKTLIRIADDFLLGRSNSLGENKTPIELARPISHP